MATQRCILGPINKTLAKKNQYIPSNTYLCAVKKISNE